MFDAFTLATFLLGVASGMTCAVVWAAFATLTRAD